MNKKYIVKDKDGHYQSAYNLLLGQENAYQWAVQCARAVKGSVFLVDDSDGSEKKMYDTSLLNEIS